MDHIVIRGARQHNLKNISVAIPRNRFIVITGVSGSGKSTLALDTIFAEGQRRYLEALSTRTRQFIARLEAPKVDAVEGLSPAIAVGQAALSPNPRSTVGTLTEINDFLRRLYSHLGVFHCPTCGIPVRAHTIPQMAREINDTWHPGARILILGPVGYLSEEELPKMLAKIRRDGFARVRVGDRVYDLDPLPLIPRRTRYPVDIVVDRIIVDPHKPERLTGALELASQVGRGSVGVSTVAGEEKRFSETPDCLSCGLRMPEPSPALFSFNHPSGACPACRGLGYSDPRPDPPSSATPCPQCQGTRLNNVARSVRMGDLPIHELCRLPISVLRPWLRDLPLTPIQKTVAKETIAAILHRLKSLEQLGLGYLTLERPACTLSGGEVQRLRLAHHISTPLSGVVYVLDEPSIGLHPRDHQRLLDILQELLQRGNTLIVVEHDRETILQADFVVDMGPGAGVLGGEVIFAGPPAALTHHSSSLTGLYLSGQKSIAIPRQRTGSSRGTLTLIGARGHNLKRITVSFPLGCITCVTGVSGSGKTTLVMHTLYRILMRHLHGSRVQPAPYDRLENANAIRKVILVDQAPLGRSPHSTPATYSGAFSAIRELFAQLPEARARGYGSKRFSFNIKGGRCESCKGEGLRNINMFFLPDIAITCSQCEGRRYQRETLQILFKGHTIADVLEMTVTEACGLFGNVPSIARILKILMDVGLGYIRMGQSSTTLSGGEAQRVKLALELSRPNPGPSLYILDEPTTGLHFDDIRRLLDLLQRLVDQGHTVILIEHHIDVIKTADYVIDLGPEGGDRGGYLVASGTPEEIAAKESSHTGRFLKRIFESAAETDTQPWPQNQGLEER